MVVSAITTPPSTTQVDKFLDRSHDIQRFPDRKDFIKNCSRAIESARVVSHVNGKCPNLDSASGDHLNRYKYHTTATLTMIRSNGSEVVDIKAFEPIAQ